MLLLSFGSTFCQHFYQKMTNWLLKPICRLILQQFSVVLDAKSALYLAPFALGRLQTPQSKTESDGDLLFILWLAKHLNTNRCNDRLICFIKQPVP